MRTRPPGPRLVVALLLILSTVAFAVGVAVERSVTGEAEERNVAEAPAAVSGEQAEGEEGEAGERHEEGEAAEAGTADAGEEAAHAEEGEAIFGVNPESTGAIVGVVALSLFLAAGVWWFGSPSVLIAVAAVAVLFAIFDIREALHQADESRGGLVALALIVAALHVGVAVAVGLVLSRRAADGVSRAA